MFSDESLEEKKKLNSRKKDFLDTTKCQIAGKVTAGWNQARKIFKLSSIVERFEEKTKKK